MVMTVGRQINGVKISPTNESRRLLGFNGSFSIPDPESEGGALCAYRLSVVF